MNSSVLTVPLRWSRALYDWVLRWSESRHARTALFVLALAEASFFPVPPDALLIGLCMGAYRRWATFALICTIGSIVGGAVGYGIGAFAFDLIGEKFLAVTATLSGTDPDQLLAQAQYWFNEKEMFGMQVGPWAVGIAGFTPIPYKVFTIAAGFFKMSFPAFVIASVISRSLRFFIVAGLIGLLYRRFGDGIRQFIDRYFNMLAIGFVLLLVAGFLVLKLLNGE
ncbi:MAG: YqaA family protein [Candidatus Zixiibacteriota bacterium]